MCGPGINAAAVLLCSEGNVPIEQAAMLIEALLGVPVAAGFGRPRPGTGRRAAGAGRVRCGMRDTLRADDVLCGDETPVNVAFKDIDPATGELVPVRCHNSSAVSDLAFYALRSCSCASCIC